MNHGSDDAVAPPQGDTGGAEKDHQIGGRACSQDEKEQRKHEKKCVYWYMLHLFDRHDEVRQDSELCTMKQLTQTPENKIKIMWPADAAHLEARALASSPPRADGCFGTTLQYTTAVIHTVRRASPAVV